MSRIEDALAALEVKGVIRRVRTAEGARAYGQPIGSVIVKDPLKIGKGHKKGSISKAANKPKAVRTPKAAAPHSVAAPKPKRLQGSTPEGRKAVARLDKEGFWTSDTYGSNDNGDLISILTNYEGETRAEWRDTKTQSSMLFRDGPRKGPAKEQAALHVVRRRDRLTKYSEEYDEDGKWSRNEQPRDFPGLFDYLGGVRGVDWFGEVDPDDYDISDYDQRQAMAKRDADELGIQYRDAASVGGYPYSAAGGEGWQLDINAKESVNMVLRAHDDHMPGFIETFIDAVVCDNMTIDRHTKQSGGVPIAWNGAFPVTEFTDSGRTIRKYKGVLGLPYKYWGEEYGIEEYERPNLRGVGNGPVPKPQKVWKDSMALLAETMDKKRPDGAPVSWHITPTKNIAEDEGYEDWQAAAIGTITHEMGHSIARILFNEFGYDKRAGYDSMGESYIPKGRDETASIGNKYRQEMLDMLREYGILGSKMEDLNADDLIGMENMMLSHGTQGFPAGLIDHEALKEHLSTYGSKNFHEMLAETWAGYMLHPTPGDFIRQMGALMESAANDYIETNGYLLESGELKSLIRNIRNTRREVGA